MQFRPYLLATVLVTVALAGCSDGGGGPETPDGPVVPPVEKGKGAIRGVVVDPAITPVVGATVEVQATEFSTTTSEDGGFVFVDVEPGTYFLTVAKPGWTSVQQSVEVVADVQDPPVLKVQLQRVPGTEPRAETVYQTAFIECNAGEPLNDHDCSETAGQGELLFEIPGRPDWIQVEIHWESTQPAGSNAYVILEVCKECPAPTDNFGASPNKFNETGQAVSPFITRADPVFLESVWEGEPMELLVDISSSGPALGTGVMVDQGFDVYVTYFYNVEPEEGWSFVEDGAYPA